MEKEQKSNGAIFGLIVIIILLLAGAFYSWQSNKKIIARNKELQMKLEAIAKQEASSLDALEQDINSTNTEIDLQKIK